MSGPDSECKVDRASARLSRMRRGTITSARLISEQWGTERHQCIMVTLTYRPEVYWSPDHLKAYTHAVREWARRRGIRITYVWCAEMQKRGAIHYHVIYWLPRGVMMPRADTRGWWKHGMTNTLKARNAVGYIAKYASKGGSHCLPRAARINGHAGLEDRAAMERRWWLSPKYVRERLAMHSDVRRISGLGYVALETGEIVESMYEVAGVSRSTVTFRLKGIANAPPPDPSTAERVFQLALQMLPGTLYQVRDSAWFASLIGWRNKAYSR